MTDRSGPAPGETGNRAGTDAAAATTRVRCAVSDGTGPADAHAAADTALAAVAEHVSAHAACGPPAIRLASGLALLGPLVRAGAVDAVRARMVAVLTAEVAGIARPEAEEAVRRAELIHRRSAR